MAVVARDDTEHSFTFALSDSIPVPVSVGEANGQLLLILRLGAVVDEAFVRMLNDLVSPVEDEH